MQYELKLDKNDELWKTVAGFNRYECSTLGRFRRRKTGKILKQNLGDTGYLRVGLNRNGKQECKLAHRLVAQTFLPKSPEETKSYINHINHLRNDNRVINLEWTNNSENMKHSWNGRRLQDRKICERGSTEHLPGISSPTHAKSGIALLKKVILNPF